MSVAEAEIAAPAPAVSTRFLRSELRLIFGRRRNLAGLLVLAAVPVLIAIAVKVSSPGATTVARTSSARSPRTACSSRSPP